LLKRLHDHTFRPFRVHLSDGSKFDVTEPGMFVVGMSSAILPTEWSKDDEGNKVAKNWRTIAIAHIVQFSDLNEGNGRRKTRKSA